MKKGTAAEFDNIFIGWLQFNSLVYRGNNVEKT
jgi:hypothetical protein